MRLFHKLLEAVEAANRQHRLFRKHDSLVVGVSGGPDSTALLFLLSKLRRKYSFTITIAHLNHGLRKRDSQKYFLSTKKISRTLEFDFFYKSINLKRIAKESRQSIEEAGRNERYTFFEEVAGKAGANKIVTAHTLDDQAETMLMRILRGSGLRGLSGIPFKRKQGAFEIIRPFLLCKKEDILLFLKENQVPFCVDKTNLETDFFRNRVRHKLLPFLERNFNPDIRRALSSLQVICHDASQYIEKTALKAFSACLMRRPTPKRIRFRLFKLRRLHSALQREVLFRAIERYTGHLKHCTYAHIAGILAVMDSGENNLLIQLPGDVSVKKTRDYLELSCYNPKRLISK